jgi:hypothetical protein
MRVPAVIAAAWLSMLPASGRADEPTFDLSLDQLRAKLDAAIRDDTGDKSKPDFSTIRSCRVGKTQAVCSFHDAGYQSSIAEFKRLNLVNGHFDLKMRLVVGLSNGKVSSVELDGDRGDPANLFEFNGSVIDLMRVWDPDAGRADPMKVADTLGTMRGNDAQDIGKKRTDIEDYAEIDCLTVPSDESTKVACLFTPRS